MLVFGLGTVPMMLGVAFAGNKLNISFRVKLNKFLPYLTLLIGLLFLLRGLSLNIPYLSPDIQITQEKKVESCCTTKICH